MKYSGCAAISYGVEFGSQEMLDYFNKGLKLEDIEKAFYLTKKAGIWTTGYIMINQYSPNLNVLRQTQKLLLKIKPNLLRISPLIVNPGSKLYYLLKKQGCLQEDYNRAYLDGDYLKSKYLTRKELEGMRNRVYMAYYLRSDSLTYIAKQLFGRK